MKLNNDNILNKDFQYKKELKLALKKVKRAYKSVQNNNSFKINFKIDDTLVTDVDLLIEKYLINEIKKIFPEDKFLTEENYPNNKLVDRTWIIDPIDGTEHFIKKDSLWGIQLAFFDKEAIKFSVIFLPEKKELYYAVENQGAYLNNEKIILKNPAKLKMTTVEFGGSICGEYETKKLCVERLVKDDSLIVSNILLINSCCISYTNLVSGKTDALIIATKKPWDILPGEFICKECGISTSFIDLNKNVKLITNNESIKKVILTTKH